MAILKLLSAALVATAVIAAPAMAREHHGTSRHSIDSTYAGPESDAAYAFAPYGYRGYGYRCVPAPRVGSFAGQPWTNDVPCEPWTGAAY
jgi:hypothetical protein